MPMPYKNNPEYWLKELDRQEKRVPMTNQRLAKPVARASSGWNSLMNEAEGTRSPARLAGFMEQRLTAPRAAPMTQPRLQTQAPLADVREQVREREASYPGYTDVIRGDELSRHFFKGPLAGQERRLGELGPLGYELSPGAPGGVKHVGTKEDIETSRTRAEYKIAQYDLMASQHLAPFMTTTTNEKGEPIRVRSEEGSKLYDKYAKMFLTDPKKAESLLKEEAGEVATKAARVKQLEAMSPEELEQFIAEEEAVTRQTTAANITEATGARQERPNPFIRSLSEIAEKRKQEEVARHKRLYEGYAEEGPLAAPRKRLVDWLNRPARRAY